MADAFISYAREDVDTVLRLKHSLEADGREVWVDVEGIPPSSAWWDEIQRAIDRAQATVFVLSPHWLGSEVARQELDHALAAGKRLIPVVAADVPEESVPPSLRERNWIFDRSSDDHDSAYQALVRALDTDLPWVNEHTRLVVRSTEWVLRDREPSLLLRGSALTEAETWLARAASHEPGATPQQVEFLIASRRAATAAQRRRTFAVASALVVALVLSVIALVQRERAQDQTVLARAETLRAEEQTAIARSQALAAHASAALQTDPELSALLAAEAYRTAPTAEAGRVLRSALGASNVVAHARTTGDAGVAFLDVSADGRTLLAIGNDELTLDLLDADTGEPSPLEPLSDKVFDVAISTDGRGIAWNASDIVGWDPVTGKDTGTIVNLPRSVDEVDLSDDGRRAAIALPDGLVAVLDLEHGGRVIQAFQAPGSPIKDLAIGPLGRHVAATIGREQVVLWEVASGEELQRRRFDDETILDITLGGPDDQLVGACGTDTPHAWVAGSDDLNGLEGIEGCTGIAFPPRGFEAAISTRDGQAVLYDVFSGRILQRVHAGDGLNRIAYVAGARAIAVGQAGHAGRIVLWRPRHRMSALAGVTRVRYDTDGSTMLGGTEAGAINTADTGTGEVIRRLSRSGSTAAGFVSDLELDGRGLVWILESSEGYASSTVTAVDLSTGKDVLTLPDEEDARPIALATRPGHDDVAVAYSDGLLSVLRDDARMVRVGDGIVSNVVYDDGGKMLATSASDDAGRVHVDLWQADTLERVRTLTRRSGFTYGLAFSPDSERVAVTGLSEPAQVVDLQGEVVTQLATSDALSVAWSPDGTLLATGNDDSTAAVWDAATGQELERFPAPESGFDVEFSPDGRELAVVGTQAVRIYPCALCVSDDELLGLVSERTGRDLTAAERERYGIDT